MPLPAIITSQLSSVGIGLITDLLSGIFGGIFGGDPAPDLPPELCWAETLVLGRTMYQPPGEWVIMGGIVHMPRHTGGHAILVESGLAVTGKGIEDRASGLIVATWSEQEGVQEVLGYTVEGYPIHGAVPGNAIYHGERVPSFIPPGSGRPVNPINVMKSTWHGNTVGGKRYGMSTGMIATFNSKLPSWQSKANSNAVKIFGGQPPVAPPSGGRSSGGSRGGFGPFTTGRSSGGSRGGSTPSRTLSSRSSGALAGQEGISFITILLVGAIAAILIWRLKK